MTKLCTVYISGKEQKVLVVYPDGRVQILTLDEWKGVSLIGNHIQKD